MDENTLQTPVKRLYSLDFLKFLLAVIIVFHHFQQVTETRFSHFNFFSGRIYFGWCVEFFFIISGFVTALGLKNKKTVNFKNWIIGKAVRIYPMAMISVLITFCACCLYRILFGIARVPFGLWRLFTSFTLTFVGGGLNVGLGFNNVLWYVCVLLICYVWVYVIQWICDRLKINPYYGFVVMCLLGVGALSYKIELPFFNNASSRGYMAFFFGMILFYIYNHFSRKILLSISTVLIVSVMFCIFFDKWIDNQQMIFTFMLFPSILIFSLSIEKVFKSKIFSFLGGVSYEMYIWHSAFILLYICAKKQLGFELIYTRTEMLIFTLCLIGIACLAYQFVEKPLIAKLKEVIKA
ncbi:MAG: acyltransferase [Treponema sp.]|nr:acyltransferase [Treponema sp.]